MFNSGSLTGVEVRDAALSEPARDWNGTATSYPRDETVAHVFESVVSITPEAVALTYEGRHLSYKELNDRANRLAGRLRAMGIGAEDLVGCCIERSFELVVALLGILKAGAAYVPIDPHYPKARFEFLVKDTSTRLLLTQRALASTILAERNLAMICLDEACVDRECGFDVNPPVVGNGASLAYVMYTSGSTGVPKGVLVENRAVVRLVKNTNYCRFTADEVFLQFAPISFDASTLEIWGPLLNGGRLVLMPAGASSLEELGQVIRREGVTTLWLTAGLFHVMVDERLDDLQPLRQILAGGDVLSPQHVRKALEGLPNCCLINGYGPTENTTFSCCYVMRSGEQIGETVPIGRPISNSRAYILGEDGRHVAPGQTGEIYTGGDGVARGYLNNPQATSEKFLPDPFAPEVGARMYRTGDLGRWRGDGTIEFLGRIDNQVKILGYRVEPGEVETAIEAHGEVRQACVVASSGDDGSKRLVAYYVPLAKSNVTPRALRQFLEANLPHYLVPGLFVPLTSMPLSPNGKVNRAELPAPGFGRPNEGFVDEAATDLEMKIGRIWAQVLHLDKVGMDDNFFDLGGDSLFLVSVHSQLQKTLQIETPLMDLFEFPTVRALAKRISQSESVRPSFHQAQQQAQNQREAFARARERRTSGTF